MVYKTEYSTRRVYSSGSPTPNTSTSYSYSANPISRRRRPLVTTRVIRVPLAVPLSDQQVLNFVTIGSGRAGSVPRIAVQRLSGTAPPPRSSIRLNDLYSELEDEVSRDSQGLGALVSYRSRSVTPMRVITPLRALTPGPIKRITYHGASAEREVSTFPTLTEIQASPIVRSRADDVLLHLALGLNPPLYSLHHIPLRSALDVKEACDVRRQFVHERNLYDPLSRLQSDVYRMAFNRAPRKLPAGYVAGNGTLACLTYAGGKPIPKRRRFYPDDVITVINSATEDQNRFNNYYKPSAVGSYYSTAGKKPIYQPVFRSKKTLLGLPDTPASYRKAPEESKWESRSRGKKSPSPPPVRQPPRRIISTTAASPPPEPAKPDNVNFTLPKPRKSVSSEPEAISPASPSQQNLDVPEDVVVRISRKSISQEPQDRPLVEPPKEEEVTQVVKLKRQSLKPEPSVDEATAAESAGEEATIEPEAPSAEPSPAEPEPEVAPATEPTPAEPEPEVAPAPAEPSPAEPEPEPVPVVEDSPAEPEPAAEPEAVADDSVAEPEPEPEPESSPAEPEPAEPESSSAESEAAPAAEDTSPVEPEPAAAEASEPEEAPAAESSAGEAESAVAESSVAESAEPAGDASAAESAPAGGDSGADEAAAEVSEAATEEPSAAVVTEEASAAAGEPSNQGEEEAVTNVEDTSVVEPSVEKEEEETDRQIASPVEGYDDDEPAEPEELPFDPEETESEAQRRGISDDDHTLDED